MGLASELTGLKSRFLECHAGESVYQTHIANIDEVKKVKTSICIARLMYKTPLTRISSLKLSRQAELKHRLVTCVQNWTTDIITAAIWQWGLGTLSLKILRMCESSSALIFGLTVEYSTVIFVIRTRWCRAFCVEGQQILCILCIMGFQFVACYYQTEFGEYDLQGIMQKSCLYEQNAFKW